MSSTRIPSPILVALLLASAAPAQDAPAAAATTVTAPRLVLAAPSAVVHVTPARPDEFVLEAGEHALANVIDRAATWLGRNYLMSESEFQQSAAVRFQSARHFDAETLERTLGQLLYARGFGIVEIDAATGLYEVIALFGPRGNEVMSRAIWRTPEEVLARRNWYEAVSTNLALEHLSAQNASNALRPYLMQSTSGRFPALTLGTLGDSRSLVLTGFGPQLAPVIEMIRLADRAAGEQARQEHVDALQKRIEQLEQQQPQRGPSGAR